MSQLEEVNKKLEARIRDLTLLSDFSQQISMTLEMDELSFIVDRFLRERLDLSEFNFQVCTEDGKGQVTKSQSGSAEKFELSIPLVFKKKVVGILNLNCGEERAFLEGEVELLHMLAVELAIAIVNAKLYARTRELSIRDQLTQIYNRRHFQDSLSLEIKRSERFGREFSLLIIDIDFFKKYNDLHGHLAGDQCLRQFVDLVSSKIREVDFFARFGGEEFVLILPNTSKKDGLKVADKIRGLVEAHSFSPPPPNAEKKLTVSIGLASYPGDGKAVEELLEMADVALYEAKEKGRNKVIVASSG